MGARDMREAKNMSQRALANQALLTQAEGLLRRIRNSPKLWEPDTTKIDRVLVKAKARMMRRRGSCAAAPVGQYSGLTKQELRRSGTCETDWY